MLSIAARSSTYELVLSHDPARARAIVASRGARFRRASENADVLAGCHAFAAKLFARTPCTAHAHRETSYNYDPMRNREVRVWRTAIVADDIFPPVDV